MTNQLRETKVGSSEGLMRSKNPHSTLVGSSSQAKVSNNPSMTTEGSYPRKTQHERGKQSLIGIPSGKVQEETKEKRS
jgi:hypothetical protein